MPNDPGSQAQAACSELSSSLHWAGPVEKGTGEVLAWRWGELNWGRTRSLRGRPDKWISLIIVAILSPSTLLNLWWLLHPSMHHRMLMCFLTYYAEKTETSQVESCGRERFLEGQVQNTVEQFRVSLPGESQLCTLWWDEIPVWLWCMLASSWRLSFHHWLPSSQVENHSKTMPDNAPKF